MYLSLLRVSVDLLIGQVGGVGHVEGAFVADGAGLVELLKVGFEVDHTEGYPVEYRI